jgi:cis-3-alkyl-4-acyloxetan-2-one decarboxylase
MTMAMANSVPTGTFDRNVTQHPKEFPIMTTPDLPADAFNGARHVIDGLSVYCVDTAPAATARPTVVAVHGIPESSVAWRDVAAVVGDSARMVIPDLPGFGQSDKPSDYDYSLARQSRLLEELLERLVPKAPIHLAVHDIGGPVGLMWAMRNLDRVASLLILNTTMFHERFRPPPVALKALVPVIGPRAVAEALSRESEFKRRFLRPCARPIDPTTLDELYAPYRQPDACRAAALTWSAYKRGLGDFVRARRTLPRITAPTTVLFGARDPYCTPASARAFASRIPHARLRLLDDVGHFTPTEAPTEVADELNSLLQRAN